MNEKKLERAERDASRPGPETAKLLAQAPAMMAELMWEFLDRRDLNERVRIRSLIKALLDLASVDTEYPPLPADPKPGAHQPVHAAPPQSAACEPAGLAQHPNPVIQVVAR